MFHQDKKLERLVPPRELCQKIPAGKFANSALVWQCTMFLSSEPPKKVWEVIPRSECFGHEDAPAPTLDEIMEALARLELRPSMDWLDIVNEEVFGRVCTKLGAVAFRGSIATAALKLWFDVEGVK